MLDGTVKVQLDRPDGTAVILAILRAGEVVGELSLIDQLGRAASVVAMEPTRLAWLTYTDFWSCLRSMPVMAYNLAGMSPGGCAARTPTSPPWRRWTSPGDSPISSGAG